MTQLTEFSVPIESLAILKTLAKGSPNSISPLTSPEWSLSKDTLAHLGLADSDGNARPEVLKVIGVLTAPVGSTTLSTTDGEDTASHTVYFGEKDTPSVLVSMRDDSLCFRQPAPIEDLGAGLEQIIGRSLMGGEDGADEAGQIIDLPHEFGLVFAAALDHQRSTQLSQIAQDSAEPILLTNQAVKKQFGRGERHPQWLVNSVLDLAGLATPEAPDCQDSMAFLAQRGLCSEVKGGFVFRDAGQLLASRTLLLRRLIDVIHVRETSDGTGTSLRMRAHHYGNNEVLIVTQSAETFSFAVRSTAVFLAMVEASMSSPELLLDFKPSNHNPSRTSPVPPEPVPPEPVTREPAPQETAEQLSEQAKEEGHGIGGTYAEVLDGGATGAATQAESLTTPVSPVSPFAGCPRCGAAIASASAFCQKCGLSLRPQSAQAAGTTSPFATSSVQPSRVKDSSNDWFSATPERLPATILLTLSILYAILLIGVIAMNVLYVEGYVQDFEIMINFLALFISIAIGAGAMCAMTGKLRLVAILGGAFGCVPGMSPFVILGIPFAIWMIVALFRPSRLSHR